VGGDRECARKAVAHCKDTLAWGGACAFWGGALAVLEAGVKGFIISPNRSLLTSGKSINLGKFLSGAKVWRGVRGTDLHAEGRAAGENRCEGSPIGAHQPAFVRWKSNMACDWGSCTSGRHVPTVKEHQLSSIAGFVVIDRTRR